MATSNINQLNIIDAATGTRLTMVKQNVTTNIGNRIITGDIYQNPDNKDHTIMFVRNSVEITPLSAFVVQEHNRRAGDRHEHITSASAEDITINPTSGQAGNVHPSTKDLQ